MIKCVHDSLDLSAKRVAACLTDNGSNFVKVFGARPSNVTISDSQEENDGGAPEDHEVVKEGAEQEAGEDGGDVREEGTERVATETEEGEGGENFEEEEEHDDPWERSGVASRAYRVTLDVLRTRFLCALRPTFGMSCWTILF